MKSTSTIVDTDYLLALPFLKVLVADGDVKQVDTKEIADFIEVYFTFMDSRPPLMRDSRSKVNNLYGGTPPNDHPVNAPLCYYGHFSWPEQKLFTLDQPCQ